MPALNDFPKNTEKAIKTCKNLFFIIFAGQIFVFKRGREAKKVSDIVNNFNEISGVGLFYTLYKKAHIVHVRRRVAFETVRL